MTARAKPAPKPTLSGFCEAAPSYAHPADAHAACRMPGCICDCHRDTLEPAGVQAALPVPRVKVPLACLQGRHTADCGHETPAGEGAVPGEPRESPVGEDPSPAGPRPNVANGHTWPCPLFYSGNHGPDGPRRSCTCGSPPDPSLAPDAATSAEPTAPPAATGASDVLRSASAREGELLEIDEHGLAVAPLEESDHGWPAEAGAALEQLLGTPVSPITPTRLHDNEPYATDPLADLEAAAELVERSGYAPSEPLPQAPHGGQHNHTFTPAHLVCTGCGGYLDLPKPGRWHPGPETSPATAAALDTSPLDDEEKRIIVAAHLKLDPEAAYDAVREILARRGGGWPA